MDLREEIRRRREERHLSQEELAEAVGVSRQAVSKWESGAAQPTGANRRALLQALDLREEEAAPLPPRRAWRARAGWIAAGVLLLALALFVFVFPQVVAGFFSLVLGLLLVVGGAVNAARAIELRRYRGGTWTIALVAGIVVALGGVVIVVNPFETTVTFVLVLGVLLVLKGAADLLVSLWLTSAMKQLQ